MTPQPLALGTGTPLRVLPSLRHGARWQSYEYKAKLHMFVGHSRKRAKLKSHKSPPTHGTRHMSYILPVVARHWLPVHADKDQAHPPHTAHTAWAHAVHTPYPRMHDGVASLARAAPPGTTAAAAATTTATAAATATCTSHATRQLHLAVAAAGGAITAD